MNVSFTAAKRFIGTTDKIQQKLKEFNNDDMALITSSPSSDYTEATVITGKDIIAFWKSVLKGKSAETLLFKIQNGYDKKGNKALEGHQKEISKIYPEYYANFDTDINKYYENCKKNNMDASGQLVRDIYV